MTQMDWNSENTIEKPHWKQGFDQPFTHILNDPSLTNGSGVTGCQ